MVARPARTRQKTQPPPLAERIAAAMAKLTPTESSVARFFVDYRDDVVFMSAAEVAEKAEVGTATVVRAAQKLGYSGFPALKRELRALLRDRGAPSVHVHHSMDVADGDPATMLQRTLGYQVGLLDKARSSVDASEFQRAVEILARAKRIGIVDFGRYTGNAQHFARRLRFFGRSVLEIHGRGEAMAQDLVEVTKGDAVVVLGFGRISTELAALLAILRDSTVPVVLIADTLAVALRSPMVAVLAADGGSEGPFDTAIISLALLEALLFAFAGGEPRRVRAAMARGKAMAARLRVSRGAGREP
jgi:DNA-binding MurR/RpiR family transcriptional regulator